jgi:hypothetical protein
MSTKPYSELEVVPGSLEAGNAEKHAYYAPEHYNSDDTQKVAYSSDDSHKILVHEQDRPRTICGLRKRTFYIIVIAALVVIVAAIGGGVGGALASKSSNAGGTAAQASSGSSTTPVSASISTSASTSTPASTLSTNPTRTATPTPTEIISTTTIVGPSATLLRDCPSSNNTLYTVTSNGKTQRFRKTCDATYANAFGGDAMVVRPFASLNQCITECAAFNQRNATEIQQGTSRRCNAVCWRNDVTKRDVWPGGQCFGYTTRNTTAGDFSFLVSPDPKLPATVCDGGALIDTEF